MREIRVGWDAMARAWLPAVFAGVLTAVLAGAWLQHSDFHNPLDEYTHYDFVIKVAQDLSIPRMSDTMGQTALQEWACSGEPSFAALTCGESTQDPAKAPWAGSSPATGYSIPYYVITGVATRLIHMTVPSVSWMDAARIASVLWLVSLAVLIVAVGRRLGGPTAAVVAAAILVCSLPQVLIQGSSVGNDIPTVVMTFLAVWVWLALRGSSPGLRWGVSLVFAVLALLFKPHAILALGLVSGLEFAERRRAPRTGVADGTEPASPWSRSVLVVGGGAVVAILAFGLMYYVLEPAWRGVGPPVVGMEELLRSVEPQDFGLANAKAYGQLAAVFLAPGYVAALSTPWASNTAAFAAMVALGGGVFAVLRSTRPWRADPTTILRQITLAYVVVFPVSFMLYLKLLGTALFFQSRYHFIGMILGLVLVFYGSSRRWGLVALAGSLAVWLFMLGEVTTPPPS